MSTKPKHPNLPPRHPLSAIFPEHGGEPLQLLAKDLKLAGGLRNPIVLFEGMTLDGWRRGLACEIAGIEPIFRQFKGSRKEAAAFVWSENFHRRNLGPGELPLVAARYQLWLKENPDDDIKLGEVPDKFGTSKSSVDAARKVLKSGEPEVVAAVEQGRISISDAARIADKPPEVQQKAVEAVVNRQERTVAKAAAKDEASRNGKPVFDDKTITDPFGKLMRACVERRKSMGLTDADPNFSAVNELLSKTWKALGEWGVK